MPNSMISTVLEIENEAEAVLAKADQEAAQIVADARAQCLELSRSAEDKVRREIAELEALAANERERKVKELTAAGDAALSAVKNVSDAAYDSGVQRLMDALAGR